MTAGKEGSYKKKTNKQTNKRIEKRLNKYYLSFDLLGVSALDLWEAWVQTLTR